MTDFKYFRGYTGKRGWILNNPVEDLFRDMENERSVQMVIDVWTEKIRLAQSVVDTGLMSTQYIAREILNIEI